MNTKLTILLVLAAFSSSAQTNNLTVTNHSAAIFQTNEPLSRAQRVEKIRAECLLGRRMICGKILKVLPEGVVVDSGYTDLLRPPLNNSWLVTGIVTASKPASLVEGSEPEAVCVGTVFLTDFPKSRGAALTPKQYDYVILLGYPTGEFTYASVGTLQKTVRRFSGDILSAISLNLEAAEKSNIAPAASVK